MSLLLRRILPALAIMAMAYAQVFGIGRGFMCACGGVEKITMEDHCHGPHSAVCHQEEEEHTPHHHSDDDHQDGDTHEHPALIESLLASVSPELDFSTLAPVVTDWALSEWLSTLPLPGICISTPALSEHPPPATHRPWPQLLAHTVALRI